MSVIVCVYYPFRSEGRACGGSKQELMILLLHIHIPVVETNMKMKMAITISYCLIDRVFTGTIVFSL